MFFNHSQEKFNCGVLFTQPLFLKSIFNSQHLIIVIYVSLGSIDSTSVEQGAINV